MSDSAYRCPQCGKVYGLDVFNCPECEVILNHTLVEKLPDAPKEPSVVRRMLAPDNSLERPEPTAPGVSAPGKPNKVTSPTIVMPYPEPRDGIPTLIRGIDLTEIDVTVFEAYVLSRIDGSSTVEQLRQGLGLSKLEVNVVLKTLKDKQVIRVESKDERPVPEKIPKKTPAPANAGDTSPSAERRSRPSLSASIAPVAPPRPPRPRAAKKRVLGAHGTERLSGQPSSGYTPIPKDGKSSQASQSAPASSPETDNPLQQAIRLEKKGDFEGAIGVLEKAIAGSPNPAALYNRLALVLIKERRDFLRAEELLNKAAKLAPNSRTISNNLAKVLMMIASNSGLVEAPARRKKW